MFVCEGAMALLRPLLLDVAPNIQQTAALALGRLANYNEDLAEAVVKGDILPQLVYSLAEQNVIFFVYIHGQQKFFSDSCKIKEKKSHTHIFGQML